MILSLNRAFQGLVFLLVSIPILAQDEKYTEFNLEVELSDRLFFQEGLYPGQEQNYLSIAATPEFLYEWAGGVHSIKFMGFGRLDQYDKKRTHADIRELYWQTYKGNSELSVGVKKIFWGKTESAHLVDIINQTDQVESFDGEAKLGELMVHFSQITNAGTFEFFVLPYFRIREFPARKGRLRPGSEDGFVFYGADVPFQSTDKESSPSVATRWSHYVGKFDFGVSYFHGTGREPIITDLTTFNAIYGIIDQVGLEVQATTGPVLIKLESIVRQNKFQDVMALATGFEYTFGNVNGKGLDIGVLAEYLYDDRDDLALNGLQSDIFSGIRLGFNDTQDSQVLMGSIFDLNRTTEAYFIEAKRRVKSTWSAEVEARIFNNVDPSEFNYFTRRDGFFQIAISKFF